MKAKPAVRGGRRQIGRSYAKPKTWLCLVHAPFQLNGPFRSCNPRGGDGGLSPCMDDSDGMGVQRGAGHSPAGFFARRRRRKIWANPSEYMKYTNFQPYLEHIHSRFRSRIVTFHHRISCSSSHSFRNLLYRVRFLSLVNQLNERPGSYSVL